MAFTDEQKKASLSTPHQLFVVDQTLKLSKTDHQVKLTLGYETPQETLLPACTIAMPLDFAIELSKTLNAVLKSK